MKQRCYNEKVAKYHLYGAKGIKVCKEWQNFNVFEEWAYNNGYREYLTIDRIDGNKDYTPKNCRWATYKEQSNNTSRNHIIEIDGQAHTISEWADVWQVPYSTSRNKVYRLESKGQAS